MKPLRWLNFPAASLLMLLQRTPAVRVAVSGAEFVAPSRIATLLKSALATATSLGAVHSLAGATQFVLSASSVAGTVGTAITPVGFTVTGAAIPPGSFRVSGTVPPGLGVSGANGSGVLNASTGFINGTPTLAGTYTLSILAYERTNAQGDSFGPATIRFTIASAPAVSPTISSQPSSASVSVGSNATFSVTASGSPSPTYQWRKDGAIVSGGTTATLTLPNVQSANAGTYTVTVTNSAGSATSQTAILGVSSAGKLVGIGTEFPDILHPGTGFTYDQVLLGGAAASVTADPGQILRISFLDLNDDIVQVEFSGAGTLTLVLDNPSGPAAPLKYNQPAVAYMKGHAGIILTGANKTTNLTVFSVGRAIPGSNPALYFDDVTYDGFADIAFIAIASTDGEFAGLRAANASFFATKGITGIHAPNVQFNGPVFVNDIGAFGAATPVLRLGSGSDVRITGGDLLQDNGQAVQVSGISQLRFTAGSNSHGTIFSAQANQGQFVQNGSNVTSQIVVNQAP